MLSIEVHVPHSLASLRISQLATQVVRLAGDLTASGNLLVSDLALTSARWQVLASVLERPATVASIARELGLTRQSVLSSARRLVDDGLAELVQNPGHRRARLLAATRRGARVMAEVRRRHEAWAQRLAQAVAGDEVAVARRVLHQLEDHLRTID
jgi:DNA-binding MarR family transcriptional regulator